MNTSMQPLQKDITTVEYTIGELAGMYGVSLRTLRFYEEKDFLKPRRVGNLRIYSASDRVRLESVLAGKRLGFTLAQIWELIETHSNEGTPEPACLPTALSEPALAKQIDLLESRRNELDGAIEELSCAYARVGGS